MILTLQLSWRVECSEGLCHCKQFQAFRSPYFMAKNVYCLQGSISQHLDACGNNTHPATCNSNCGARIFSNEESEE